MSDDLGKEVTTIPQQEKQGHNSAQSLRESGLPIDNKHLEEIAQKIPFDENDPPKIENLTFPLVNHPDFNQLGTAVMRGIYTKLTQRETPAKDESFYNRKVEFANQFIAHVKEQRMPIVRERKPGQTAFHFNSPNRIHDIHAYYFNKTSLEWQNPNQDQVRAYITIDPAKITEIGQNFADLAILYTSKEWISLPNQLTLTVPAKELIIWCFILPNHINKKQPNSSENS